MFPSSTLAVLVCLILTFQYGCAYFNMFYNAKKKYREAKALPVQKDGSLSRQHITIYDDVIEKCQQLITTYPNSKWVDDAVLLIGKSYYEQREYDKAIQTLEALKADFPDSELNEEATEYLARSYIAKDRLDDAAILLKSFLEKYPKSRYKAVTLYLLGTVSLKAGREDEAMTYLETLAREHATSRYKLRADLEMAEIFLEREEYEKSIHVYERLLNSKLRQEEKIRCLMKLSEAYIKLERYGDALSAIREIEQFVLPLEEKADVLLLKSESYVGLDSLNQAIGLYRMVGSSYPKTKFSAEGYYQLGIIYQEKLDSLETAKGFFERVSGEYAKSRFADEALERSSNISKLLRLRSSLGEANEEEKAFAGFSLAEVQLFQFNNLEEAIAQYRSVLNDYPESDVAPKAAYAIGYIYAVMIGDTLKAREAYEYLLDRFPDSQQAAYAKHFLGGTEE